MDAFTGLHIAKGTYNPVQLPEYKERVSYDANGNIKTYIRNGDKARLNMDSLLYIYQPNNNQLTQVLDYMPDNNLYNDIKSGQAANNYSYDAIGNLIADQQEGINAIKWNVYGKIASINKSTGAINYFYDASGNRVMKQTPTDTVAYVRDASGNVLSVYNKNKNGLVQQSETYLYGSSRLGVVRAQRVAPKTMKLNASFNDAKLGVFTRGEKLYELSNHLQNVLVTVSDKRLPVTKNNDTVVSGYTAVVVSASDYYPFGMEMVGRGYNSKQLINGFNGKRYDNEIYGEGNFQDYGARMYNPRLGRFSNPDPKFKLYPMLSTYQFASNTPIQAVDLDGKEAFIVHGTTQTEAGVHITPEAKKELMRITGNTKNDDKFRWNAPIYNNSMMRSVSANQLVKHILRTRMAMIKNRDITEDETISLIGYSHGGNVSIHAATKLGAMGVKVNLVTLSTPAYNTSGNDAYGGGLDPEDPRGAANGINDHYQIVHEKDDVVNIAGGTEKYSNGKTKNFVITNKRIPYKDGVEAHTAFPSDGKLDDVLKVIPAMSKAPAPKKISTEVKKL